MSSEKIVIDDCIVLGNAVPDEISDNRFTVCTAGYSPKHGLIRIYPVPPNAQMRRWNMMQIPLERNPKDNRSESWKVQGSKDEWRTLPEKMRVLDKLERPDQIALINKLYAEYGASCIDELNDKKLSFGLIKPEILGHDLIPRPKYDPTVQMTLDSMEQFLTINNYPYIPKVKYRCSECTAKEPHYQQVVEWGFYEYMRQFPNSIQNIWENAHLDDPAWDKTFLVGNQNLYRRSFMIISVFRFKMTPQKLR